MSTSQETFLHKHKSHIKSFFLLLKTEVKTCHNFENNELWILLKRFLLLRLECEKLEKFEDITCSRELGKK